MDIEYSVHLRKKGNSYLAHVKGWVAVEEHFAVVER